MAEFDHTTRFVVETCCNCGVQFAMTRDFQRRRLDDQKLFHCPAGHPQRYVGQSEAQRLKGELDRKNAQVEKLNGQVQEARRERDTIAKAHRKMRARVMNGVCPCCNRSFDNLRRHMASQHPDFGEAQTLRALREAFGMTQAQVAAEAFTNTACVSNYENGKPVPVEARERLEGWLNSQNAA